MRVKFFAVIVFLIFVLVRANGAVNAQSGVEGSSFGIRPTKAYEDRAETFVYFSYELAPGVEVSDEALVMNNGSVPVTLKLYAADGITAQNGSTAFTEQGKTSTGGSQGVSNWINLQANEIALEPGQEITVPFTLKVPTDAEPGHHVAGLVVEALPNEGAPSVESEYEASPNEATLPVKGESEAEFAVNVIQRVGVAVVVDVPGPHIAGLEIDNISLNQQDDNGATFVIAVHNIGNIFITAEGFLTITDTNLQTLATFPVELDTVLPGDQTIYYVNLPVNLSDSDYLVHASLTYEGGTAEIEGLEVKVRDGQPVIDSNVEESVIPPSIYEIILPKPGFDLSDFIYKNKNVIYGLLFSFAILDIVIVIMNIRKNRRKK